MGGCCPTALYLIISLFLFRNVCPEIQGTQKQFTLSSIFLKFDDTQFLPDVQ
jgi:hypothetical protein